MKNCFFIFLFVLSTLNFRAQTNLVPNPSFEFFTTCPTFYSQLNYAYPWFAPSIGTPDYFNSCNIGVVGVPMQAGANYQQARTGVAYAGAGLASGYREYISCRLNDSLIKDKNYCIEFYMNNANATFFVPSDSLVVGMYISNDSISDSSSGILPHSPQIFNPYSQYINDTSSWMKISGTYKALGGEVFITIGFFYSDASIGGGGYFYFEDVSIVECDSEVDISNIPNIFSPNNDNQNDYIDFSNLNLVEEIVDIYNRWGNKVFQSSASVTKWDGKDLKGNDCSEGVYYYVFHYSEFINKEIDKKGFIQLVR